VLPIKIAVGIATVGRRKLLAETLRQLSNQTRLPDCVFVSPVSEADYDAADIGNLPYPLQIIYGSRGLCSQRNSILNNTREFTVIVFFDDDFFPESSYLREVELCFEAEPNVVVTHGHLIADGVRGPGIDISTARNLLSSCQHDNVSRPLTDTFGAYGCNMAVRLSSVYEHDLHFDEEMPLYGWMEDLEFCRRISAHGRIVKNWRMIGVHLGTKVGRISGLRYGYSQVANPIYIWRKGRLPFFCALKYLMQNALANVGKALRPEPWIDRRGRALGNCRALSDWIRGRMHPMRILDLE
jgi:GT2 family glycosyltransferase